MSGVPRRRVPGRARPGPERRAVPGRGVVRVDRGSVLLETAIAIPVLLVVLLAAMWVVGIGTAHLRVGDGARQGARVAARGEDDAAVRAAARQSAPGASVAVVRGSELVAVRLTERVRPPIPFLRGLGVTVAARATAAVEPEPMPGVLAGALP